MEKITLEMTSEEKKLLKIKAIENKTTLSKYLRKQLKLTPDPFKVERGNG